MTGREQRKGCSEHDKNVEARTAKQERKAQQRTSEDVLTRKLSSMRARARTACKETA